VVLKNWLFVFFGEEELANKLLFVSLLPCGYSSQELGRESEVCVIGVGFSSNWVAVPKSEPGIGNDV
jgi:hypothetical protein